MLAGRQPDGPLFTITDQRYDEIATRTVPEPVKIARGPDQTLRKMTKISVFTHPTSLDIDLKGHSQSLRVPYDFQTLRSSRCVYRSRVPLAIFISTASKTTYPTTPGRCLMKSSNWNKTSKSDVFHGEHFSFIKMYYFASSFDSFSDSCSPGNGLTYKVDSADAQKYYMLWLGQQILQRCAAGYKFSLDLCRCSL